MIIGVVALAVVAKPAIAALLVLDFICYPANHIVIDVENVSFKSTWSGRDDNWLNVQSRDEIMNWWKTKGKNKDLNDLML